MLTINQNLLHILLAMIGIECKNDALIPLNDTLFGVKGCVELDGSTRCSGQGIR